MESYHNILEKLNQFSRKYYNKMLVKGILLFLFFGLLFFLGTLALEYFLWLGSMGRLILLLFFIGVELYLLFRYILTPFFYLFKFKEGIDNKEASRLIGIHFPEVADKLYNLLDLAEDGDRSELLMASIEQRSRSLDTIPFSEAISFKDNVKYIKYLAIPGLIFCAIWLSGNLSSFFGSYERVVNYDLAYEPPAPFSFSLISGSLDILESETYRAEVITEGEIKPENVFIVIKGKEFLLQEMNGFFQYTFSPPLRNTDFYFKANGVNSRTYKLNALRTPSIQDFNISLDYPDYTNKPTETLKSTGNAVFPEGTKVTWKISGRHTEEIHLIANDTVSQFSRREDLFQFTKRVYNDLSYQLATSNKNVSQHEKLNYSFTVLKDAYPTIKAKQVLDSLEPNIAYYAGEASDDYRLSSIRLVCYPDSEPTNKQVIQLGKPNANFDQFYYTFPSGLKLEQGRNYSLYFEATDNDAIHKGKTTKSQVFSTAVFDDNQLKNKQLEHQQSIIDNLDRSLEKFKEQKESLKEINREQKEKSALNFNEQNQIKDFLKKQQQQENLMQKFSKQLKDNLDKSKKNEELNKLLKERLERQEIEARKNEKLLEELNKVADKIDKEELSKRLEELGKKQQNNERNLEQLLELTKRYYVTEKASQLAEKLNKLAEEQKSLSELKQNDDFSSKEQKNVNEKFNNLSKELDELKKDNQNLKKPLSLEIDDAKKESVKSDQREALEEINKQKGEEEPSEERKKN
ncbi:MAG: DUF4175 family protein, partial [Bacteroidota bacterium]